MPDGKQDHVAFINTVENEITTLAEGDKPLAIFGVHIFCRMTNARLRCYDFNTSTNDLHRTDCCVRIFIG